VVVVQMSFYTIKVQMGLQKGGRCRQEVAIQK
jgi:hypothetical protein